MNNKTSKWITILIVVTVLCSYFPIQSFAKNEFIDVPANKWFADAVYTLASYDVVSGVGNNRFNPNGKVTRAEAAAFMARAFKLDLSTNEANQFRDVPKTAWYYPYVGAVAKEGFIVGYNGQFNPNDPLTRGQLVTILLRAIGASIDANINTPFTDIKGHFFEKEINTAYQLGITNGKTATTFEPNGNVSRAEFVSFLYRDMIFLQLPVVLDGEQNPDDELVINAVEATTGQVSHQMENQTLQFLINHSTISKKKLVEAGYSIEFVATKNVFESSIGTKSETGILSATKLNKIFQGPLSERKFSYQVFLYKGEEVYQSSVKEVKILDYNTLAHEILDYEVYRGSIGNSDIEINSQILVTGEKYYFHHIKATLKNGITVSHLPDYVDYIQYESSNPNVAIVNWRGEITPVSKGNVTITITSGDASKQIDFQVENKQRIPSQVTTKENDVKLASSDANGQPIEKNVKLTLLDQYGDPVYNVDPNVYLQTYAVLFRFNQIDVPYEYNSTNSNRTLLDGTVDLTLKPEKNMSGVGTIEIVLKSTQQNILTMDLTITQYTDPVSWELGVKNSSDELKLDRHNPISLPLRLKGFNSTGAYIGDQDFHSSNFSVKSSNLELATVTVNGQDIIVTPGVDETKTGKVTITAYMGGLAISSVVIDVVDTKPKLKKVDFKDVKITLVSNHPLQIDADIIQSFMLSTGESVTYEVVDTQTVAVKTAQGTVATIKLLSNVLDKDMQSIPTHFVYGENGKVFLQNANSVDGYFPDGATGEMYIVITEVRASQAFAMKMIPVNLK